MTQAARINDPVSHSPSMNWLLKGVVAGAAIGLGTVAIVGTGGLAAAALVGGLAAGGAGIGEMMSTMSWAPKEVCGVIKGDCSGDVFINGMPAARAHVDVVDCHKHSPPYPPIATGSATVFINGQPAARVDDKVGCSAVITNGSHNVFIGGDTVQTDVLQPENLVPAGVHAALLVVGVGSAIVLGGPIVATAGLVGGVAGQFGGEWIGGKAFGVGSDGQKWSMLGGSLLGGVTGAKGGAGLAGKWISQSLLKAQGAVEGKSYGPQGVLRQSGAGGEAAEADDAYAAIRTNSSDVDAIAKNTGIKPLNIQKVKNHLFYDEHLLDRYESLGVPGEMKRFDSNIDIANAWRRLEAGDHTSTDIQLLRHEAAEAWYMRKYGPSYNNSHNAAQGRYPSPLE